jgi:hypothetical protein
MSKAQIIKNLKDETYCRIGISKIPKAGVGVIAVRDIPIGVDPFKLTGSTNPTYKMAKVTTANLKGVPKPVLKMLEDFIFKESDGSYHMPAKGLNTLDISFYLNHSKKPNVTIYQGPKSSYMGFKTNKKIKRGSELTINYNKYKD